MSNEKRKTKNDKRILARLWRRCLYLPPARSSRRLARSSAERWVGTWSTALVGRPQMPPPPGPPAPAPFMRNACPAPPAPANPPAAPPPASTFAPPPFMHFTNQTLRQIVRTSVGGSRLRVVLSNTFGTAPLTIGAAHIALRDKEDAIQAAPGGPLDVQRPNDRHYSGERHCLQRSCGAGCAAVVRPCGRSVPARHDELPGGARDAHLVVPDVLHLRNRQSRRHREAADRCDHSQLVSVVTGRG